MSLTLVRLTHHVHMVGPTQYQESTLHHHCHVMDVADKNR